MVSFPWDQKSGCRWSRSMVSDFVMVTWWKRSCLGHLALFPSLETALWAGDLLHHVAESHLAKTRARTPQAWCLLPRNIQDWFCKFIFLYCLGACDSLTLQEGSRSLCSKMEILFLSPMGFPMLLDHCPASHVGSWSSAVPPPLEPLRHLLRGCSA